MTFGFSSSNLWYMKKWYLFYTNGDAGEKLQRAVGELQVLANQYKDKLYQTGAELIDSKLQTIFLQSH